MINIWIASKKSIFFRELCDEVLEAVWQVYVESGRSKSMTARRLGVPRSTLIGFFDYVHRELKDERFRIKKAHIRLVGASWKERHGKTSRVG